MASPSGNPTASSSPQPPPSPPMLFRPVNPNSPLPTSAPFYGAAAAVPPGPYSYPPATPPYHIRPFMPPYGGPEVTSVPRAVISYPNPNPNQNPSPNAGVRLMQLLGNNNTPPSNLESALSLPPPQNPIPLPNSNPSPNTAISAPVLPVITSVPPSPSGPTRMPSTKMPRGRHLGDGDRTVHDVDSKLSGESQAPQLEVSPITKYTSDPGLVLGRQIAVNRSYIVYGLKLGNIRVLNCKTALRSLLRGHTQRVTDMAFFAEEFIFSQVQVKTVDLSGK